MDTKIVTVERGIGIGETRCMLIGRNAAGEWVVGIPVRPKDSIGWATV